MPRDRELLTGGGSDDELQVSSDKFERKMVQPMSWSRSVASATPA
jgi:hypothetical protein